jgi:S1-C subfamily serine protease
MKYIRPAAVAAIALIGLFLTGSLSAQYSSPKTRNDAMMTLTRVTNNREDISKEVRQLRQELNSLKNSSVVRSKNINETEARPLLGIVPGERGVSGGISISEITPNSGAEKAGLLEGDVILALDGKKVDSHSDITSTISAKKPNDNIAVTIVRNGKEQVIFATLGAKQRMSWTVTTSSNDNAGTFKTFTVNFDDATKEWANSLNQYNSIQWTSEKETANPCEKLREMRSASLLGVYVNYNAKNGVGVQDIIENTGAQYSGLQSGDIITSISGTEVRSYPELRRAVTAHKPGESIVVTFLRDGKVQRVNSTLSSIADTRQEIVASLEAECSNIVVPESKNAPGIAQTGIQSGDTPVENPILSLSPNPTSGIATLHFAGDAKQGASISVVDLNGAVVLTQELSVGTMDATLDLTSFPKGMYIINVRQSGREFSEKIVVN